MDETNTMQENEQNVQRTEAETKGQQTVETNAENLNAFQKFLSGLFGGDKNRENEEKNQETAEAADVSVQEKTTEGTFTQADMDAAIEAAKKQWMDEAAEAERVKNLSPEQQAAEEQKKKDVEIANLKNQLLQKELRENATKTLEKDGYPVGLAEVLDYSSKEAMEKSLNSLVSTFKSSLELAVQTRLRGKTPAGLGGTATSVNLIRDQIAKNIRGL